MFHSYENRGGPVYSGYFRDAETGLDYADQRYHQTGMGRFITPDPAGDGLNHYAYVGGDPVNHIDPLGLFECADLEFKDGFGTRIGTVREIMTGTSEFSLLAAIMWHEAGPYYPGDTLATLRTEQLWIGTAMYNRLAISTGGLVGYSNDGKAYSYKFFGNTLSEVILQAAGNDLDWGIFKSGKLGGNALSNLELALGTEAGYDAFGNIRGTPECSAVVSAIWAVFQLRSGTRVGPAGAIALAWNSSANGLSQAADYGLNPELLNLGSTDKVDGNTFFGLSQTPPPGVAVRSDPGPDAPPVVVGGGRSR